MYTIVKSVLIEVFVVIVIHILMCFYEIIFQIEEQIN